MKKMLDSVFSTPDVCVARLPKHPVILHRFLLRENASYTCGACVDALTSGMIGSVKNNADGINVKC